MISLNRTNIIFSQIGKPYLGYTDKLGASYVNNVIATGYGNYLAMPLLREETDKRKESGQPLTEAEAIALIQKCLQVLYYRDARSFNQYTISVINEQGTRVEGPFKLTTNWEFATMVKGYE